MRPSYLRHKFRSIADYLVRYFYGHRGLLVRKRMAIRAFLICLIVLIGLVKTDPQPPEIFQQVLDRGELNIGFRLGPLIYYERDDLAGGLDYYLLKSFADSYGLQLRHRVVDEIPQMLAEVQRGEIDIAAANLTITEQRKRNINFSLPYLEVTPVVIQHSSKSRIESVEQLYDKDLVAIAGSSHAEILANLKQEYPLLSWREEPETLMFELMQRVQNREIEYAVVDSSLFELERPFFPQTEIGISLGEAESLAFALQKSRDDSLVLALNRFLTDYRNSGELDLLVEDIFSNNENFNVASSLVLKERIAERLPDFEALFRQVGEDYGFDWVMLAAIAYQESHWDPQARSHTGVRGLMMLTLPTAGQFGVTSRLDPEQSLTAGAQYLLSLKGRLPDRIEEPDRTQMALAAYNMGMGHLEDARVLTQRLGGNPDLWKDIEQNLPLLQQSQYYRTLRHGYARGLEAQTYVRNIYHFYNILESYAWQKELEAMDIRMEYERNQLFEEPLEEEFSFPSLFDNLLSPM